MADDALVFISHVFETKTEYGLYREECSVYRRKFDCICNFWISDETLLDDRTVTDIMGFIISKNILHASLKIDDREVSFRIEMVVTDEKGEKTSREDLPSGVFDRILYRAVADVGEKRFSVFDFYARRRFFLDSVDADSADELMQLIDDDKKEEFTALIRAKKEILQRFAAES